MTKKIILSLMLVFTLALTAVSCGEDTTVASTEAPVGETLRVYCWNDEFQGRFRDYYPDWVSTNADGSDLLADGTTVEWVIVANQDNAYQNALDLALLDQDSADAEDRIDIFLVEADYALKYVNTDYTLDVMTDIGLTEADMADQYQYTQDIVTDSNGAIKGSTWQATPGLFAYRRSIATAVLGSDDPAVVQAAISTWDKFDDVAADMKAAGYFMLSGYDDSYRTFSNNISNPWVNDDLEIIVDDVMFDWVTQTKTYTDMDYNNGTSLWSGEWSADQGPEGDVFGFFYSTWGINFTLAGNSLADPEAAAEVGNGIYGDWAVTEGPASYYWGGTWICAAAGTDNADLIKDVMLKLTCDKDIMKQLTLDTLDFTNNSAAMNEIASDTTYGSDFLGGQNHVALFVEAASKIDMSNISPYDQGLTENFQASFKDYFAGTVTYEQALANFYTAVSEVYPELIEVE